MHNTAAIVLNGKSIEDVNNFTYLGSIVSKNGGTNKDIIARLGKARHAFITLRPNNVKSVLLYGSET